jgi:hypothetical protein
MEHAYSKAVNTILDRAIEASFLGFQPYHRAIPMGGIMTSIRTNYLSCPLSDQELKTIVGRYATVRGFNMHYDG